MLDNLDVFFIRRCFQLAQLGIGSVSPNPAVGAVIVFKGRIIGEGFHKYYGGAHAEVEAVNCVSKKNKSLLPHSTIYVSLEPCFHFGKTPPCVDLILREKIKRVVVAVIDPNPKVGGKSIEKLKSAGVEVDIMNENDWTEDLINLKRKTLSPFLTRIEEKRPYIILKWAQTQDGFIGQHDRRIIISNEMTKRLVHKWRSESDAIMVGSKTILIDNPNLDNRFYFGKSPVRITFDKEKKFAQNLNIFNGKQETIVFTAVKNAIAPYIYLEDYDSSSGLKNLLTLLHEKNIGSILVEGGSTLLNSFIAAGIWNEARIVTGKKNLLEGVKAPVLKNAKLIKTENVSGDIVSYWIKEN